MSAGRPAVASGAGCHPAAFGGLTGARDASGGWIGNEDPTIPFAIARIAPALKITEIIR
jgi:hypothetical protein